MPRYAYDGPVMEFDILLTDRWKGETIAVNEQKARSNLSYQFKNSNGRLPSSRISLPGKIKMVG